jgi:hypothetical protein
MTSDPEKRVSRYPTTVLIINVIGPAVVTRSPSDIVIEFRCEGRGRPGCPGDVVAGHSSRSWTRHLARGAKARHPAGRGPRTPDRPCTRCRRASTGAVAGCATTHQCAGEGAVDQIRHTGYRCLREVRDGTGQRRRSGVRCGDRRHRGMVRGRTVRGCGHRDDTVLAVPLLPGYADRGHRREGWLVATAHIPHLLSWALRCVAGPGHIENLLCRAGTKTYV